MLVTTAGLALASFRRARAGGAALFHHRYPNYSGQNAAQSANESAGKCSFSRARTAS